MYVYLNAYVCTHKCGCQRLTSNTFLYCSSPYVFESGSLTEPEAQLVWSSCLAGELPQSIYFCLPCSVIRGMHNSAQLFTCMLESHTSKHWVYWVSLRVLSIRKLPVTVSVSLWWILTILWVCAYFPAQKAMLTNLIPFVSVRGLSFYVEFWFHTMEVILRS